MGVVKAKTNSSEPGALFQSYSGKKGSTSLSEWRGALVSLHDASKEVAPWFDIGSSTFLETEDIIGLLDPEYTLNREEEVRSWLEHHPGANEVLLALPSVVEKFFPAAGLRLEVRVDPEMTVDERLGVYIQTELSPAQAVERFMEFDSEWGDWLQDQTDGGLLLNIESRS
jgi:hypothetical protein